METNKRIYSDGPFQYNKEPSLFFCPLMVSDSGRYTCNLTLSYHKRHVILEGSQQSAEKVVKVYCKLHKDNIIITSKYLFLVAHIVENFRMTAVFSTSFNLSWNYPRVVRHQITGYNLTCVPLLTGIPVPQSLWLPSTATSATVTELRSGVRYNCTIFTITDQGSSSPLTLSIITSETGI